MTFFVTSTGSGALGGNLGGLAGADLKCTTLAAAAGGGDHTWKAYLSTNTNNGGALVNAKDRIGAGPWKNPKGVAIAANVAALTAIGFNITTANNVDEKGAAVPANEHDILTGTNIDGTAVTNAATQNANCANWTSAAANGAGSVSFSGHSDSETTASATDRWSNAHQSNCQQQAIKGQGGAGRIYCFASN